MRSANCDSNRLVGLVLALILGLASPAWAQREVTASLLTLGVTGSVCQVSTGSGAPSGGNVCDRYTDVTTGITYEKRLVGGWMPLTAGLSGSGTINRLTGWSGSYELMATGLTFLSDTITGGTWNAGPVTSSGGGSFRDSVALVASGGYGTCTDRVGSGIPASGLGADCDTYRDVTNDHFYVKLSGAWSNLSNSISGYVETTASDVSAGPYALALLDSYSASPTFLRRDEDGGITYSPLTDTLFANTTGGFTLTATKNFLINPNTTNPRYLMVDEPTPGTYAGSVVVQAGEGGAAYGGAITLFGHAHATKPGWIIAGISSGSGGKFAVNSQALGGGSDVFTVDASGNVVGATFTGSGSGLSAVPASALPNAAADGATKGVATFAAADFNASAGVISLDYANGQSASGSTKGFLSSTDWTTFNSKQAAGNYITALTGDVTASGPGSASATLANTAVSAGSYGSATAIPTFTVDAKGRLTAAGSATPQLTLTSTYFSSLSGANLTALNASNLGSGTVPGARMPALTGDVTMTAGTTATAITAGVIVDADVNASAAIGWSKISKTGSSLADLATRSAGDLSSGTLADARLSSNVPLKNGTNAFTGTTTFLGGVGLVDAGGYGTCTDRVGSGIPASGLGADCDTYRDVTNDHFYVKLSGAWSNLSNSISGYVETTASDVSAGPYALALLDSYSASPTFLRRDEDGGVTYSPLLDILYANVTGGFTLTATKNFLVNPNGTSARYFIVDEPTGGTYAGQLVMQAGEGSAGFGGAINLFGHAHATKPGWVTAGISASSGGKFTVNTSALGAGTDVLMVDATGNFNILRGASGESVFGVAGGGAATTVYGIEGGSATLQLYADNGDDNADRWQFLAADGGSIYLQSYAGGSWLSKFTFTNAGALTATGNITGANLSGTNTGDQTITLTGDVTGSGTGSFTTAIGSGVIVDADVNASAAIAWTKLSKSGSSLADLATRSAGDLSSGTLADARLSSNVPLKNGTNSFTGANTFTQAVTLSAGWPTASTHASTKDYVESYVQSRGLNLITNGSGLLGSNYNFPGSTFYQTETHGGKGSFKYTSSTTAVSTELIPVDAGKTYKGSLWAKELVDAGKTFYAGVAFYDIDGNIITSSYVMRIPNTDTTLAAPLTPGDTTITLTSSANWKNGSEPYYQRGIAVYNYKNSYGYTYPAYTYTRKVSWAVYGPYQTSGTWASGGISGNVITLTSAWPAAMGNPDDPSGTWPAGTPVSNTSAGGTYSYFIAGGVNVPNEWTNYTGRLEGTDYSGLGYGTKFWPGTAYVKLLFLPNYSGSSVSEQAISDVWFGELTANNLEAASTSYPGVVSTGSQTFGGEKTFTDDIYQSGFSYGLYQTGASAATVAQVGIVTGESYGRFIRQVDGRMEWGSGAGARDTNLYRPAANFLKTDDAFVAAQGFFGASSGSHVLNVYDTSSNGFLLDAASIPVMRFAVAGTNKWAFLVNHAATDYFGIYDYARGAYAVQFAPNGDVTFTPNVAIAGDVTAVRANVTGLSASWGVTAGVDTGGVNVVQGTSSAATWLISGTSGGTFRAGIQVLDGNGTTRFYAGANFMQLASDGTVSGTVFSGSGASLTNLNASNLASGTVPAARMPALTGDVTMTAGTTTTAIASGVIVDADVNAAAAIAWTKVSKTGSSLADLTTRSAGDLSSGTLPAARMPALTGDVTSSAGSTTTAIAAGVIVNADINASAAIADTKLAQITAANKVTEGAIEDGSILARLAANETVSGNWYFSTYIRAGGDLSGASNTGAVRALASDASGTDPSTITAYRGFRAQFTSGYGVSLETWYGGAPTSGLLSWIAGTPYRWLDRTYNSTLTTLTGELTIPATTNPALTVGSGTVGYLNIGSAGWYDDGTYFSPRGSRPLYVRDTTGTTYIYSPSIYLGPTSGTTVYYRGNALTGNSWGVTTAGYGTFAGVTSNGDVVPGATDTYDIGSPTELWEQAFITQINATIFAEETATLFGGYSIVGHDAGSFDAAVSSAATTINFGKTMTPNDFVLVRAHDTGGTIKAEYIQVGTLVSGTTYNVTRDKAGIHGTDPAWADGTPFLVLGTTGDGRVEINAYDNPRISVITQGATYNAQTEYVRIGYLDSFLSIPAGKIGFAVGDASQYLKYYDGTLTIAGNGSGITSINGGNIQTDTITASQIAANAITASELAANSITAADMLAGTITATQIATDTITASQIAANAITASELAAGSVTAADILAGTITATEIAGATITGAKIAAGTITASNIATDTITASQIAANAITASELNADSVTSAKIAANTIVAADIAAGTITGTQIAASTITASNISVTSLSSLSANLGTITAGNMTLGTNGYVRQGQTAYATGTGFWIGDVSGTPQLSIGTASGNRLTWDGTNLGIVSANFTADASGVRVTPAASSTWDDVRGYRFTTAYGGQVGMYAGEYSSTANLAVVSSTTGAVTSQVGLTAYNSTGGYQSYIQFSVNNSSNKGAVISRGDWSHFGNFTVVSGASYGLGGGNLTIPATAKAYLDGGSDTYITEASANQINVYTGGNLSAFFVATGLGVQAADYLWLDGGGDTYFRESTGDRIDMVAGGGVGGYVWATGLGVPSGDKVYFDGGGNTYRIESAADVLDDYVGGVLAFRLTASASAFYTPLYVGSIGSGTGTTAVIDASGWLRYNSSSERYKTDIERHWTPPVGWMSTLLGVSPMAFTYRESGDRALGFSAEELAATELPHLVNYSRSGQVESFNEAAMLAYHHMTLQALAGAVTALRVEVDALKAELAALRSPERRE